MSETPMISNHVFENLFVVLRICLCFTAVLRRKYTAMLLTYEFAHGL